LAIDGVILSAANDGGTLQLEPTAVAPMRMQLLALFELASVELTPEFSLAHLVLKARPDKMRLTFLPQATQTGATFEVAHVALGPSAQISEIVLHAV
jgi:hypothetical protein